MKQLFRSLLTVMIIFSVFFLTSCTKTESSVTSRLMLSENSVVFAAGGGNKSIVLTPFPENELWEASCADSQEWFTLTVSSNTLEIEAKPNHSTESRSGAVVLTSPEGRFDQYTVNVYQEGAAPLEFSTTATDHHFDSEGGEISFSVESNYQWTVEYDCSWLTVVHEVESSRMIILCQPNMSDEELSEILTIHVGEGEQGRQIQIKITQGTRADNPYFKLLGQWEITATKWFYSPNGSLNSLDFSPNPSDYYLIFDIEEGVYGETLIMRDFLYPDTSLEVRYDKAGGSFVIPFGWTVLSYDVFLYLTLVSDRQFAYASLEVEALPSSDYSSLTLDLPSVDGFNYVGFGLWTYDEDGNKIALGSNYRPTMFPMGDISFRKQSN